LHHHDTEESEENCILCSTGGVDRKRDNAVSSELELSADGGRGKPGLPIYFRQNGAHRSAPSAAILNAQFEIAASGPSLDLVDSASSSPRNLWLYSSAPAHRGPPRETSPRAPPCQA
jgi:hypothetical protein